MLLQLGFDSLHGQDWLSPLNIEVWGLILYGTGLLFLAIDIGSDGAVSDGVGGVEGNYIFVYQVFEVDQDLLVLCFR